MRPDHGRAEVYAAESAAFEGTDLESVRSFDDVASVVRAVVGGPWWPGPSIRVVPTRRNAGASSARRHPGDVTEIRLAAAQTTIATAAHELAHALAGPAAGHGPVFLAAYLDLVAVITNLDSVDRRRRLHVDQLSAALIDVGLLVGERQWPAPPEAVDSAIAL
jgi:hypothetical protein